MAYYHRRVRKSSSNQTFLLVILIVVVIAIGASQYNSSYLENVNWWMYGLGGLALFIGSFFIWLIAYQRMKRLRALQLSQIDTMSGVEFEQYVGELLKFQGYHIEFTKMSGDFGADIIARKNNIRYIYQLKRYNKPVDLHAVQEAVASMKYYNGQVCGVITNNSFTKAAKILAETNGTLLVDRTKLTDWIVAFQDKRKLPQ